MRSLYFPYVDLPPELVTLLKAGQHITSSPEAIFNVLRQSKALLLITSQAFKEFDDGRGIEKVIIALGWSNFRDRLASIYVSKIIYGNFPEKTDMRLVEDIKQLESQFSPHTPLTCSRLFLFGLYFKFLSLTHQDKADNPYLGYSIPQGLEQFLKLTQGRSEKIDWLLMLLIHFRHFYGDKTLSGKIISGEKFQTLFHGLALDEQKMMLENLISYGASIGESEIFFEMKI